MNVTVLSYNIHKGFNSTGLKATLARIKNLLSERALDIICMQEVLGEHKIHGSHLEHFADSLWPNHAYGKNSAYSNGHHGNAILSRFPIRGTENLNISSHRVEGRGLLYARCTLGESALHILCTHLGLFHDWRKKQLDMLTQFIDQTVPVNEPTILCGDFNDWNQYATEYLAPHGFLEAHYVHLGRHARTYPSWAAMLALDRIYFRNLKLLHAAVLAQSDFRELSDHLPITATFDIPS